MENQWLFAGALRGGPSRTLQKCSRFGRNVATWSEEHGRETFSRGVYVQESRERASLCDTRSQTKETKTESARVSLSLSAHTILRVTPRDHRRCAAKQRTRVHAREPQITQRVRTRVFSAHCRRTLVPDRIVRRERKTHTDKPWYSFLHPPAAHLPDHRSLTNARHYAVIIYKAKISDLPFRRPNPNVRPPCSEGAMGLFLCAALLVGCPCVHIFLLLWRAVLFCLACGEADA